MNDHKKKRGGSVLRALSMSSQVGILMAACVIIGVFLGKWIDGFLGTSPIFLLIFSLLGIGSAIYSIFNLSKRKL